MSDLFSPSASFALSIYPLEKNNNMNPDISQIQKTQKGLSRIDLHLLRLSRMKKKNMKQTGRGQHLLLQFHLLRFLSGSLTFPPWPLFVFVSFCLSLLLCCDCVSLFHSTCLPDSLVLYFTLFILF